MADYIFIFVMVFTGGVSLWGMFHKPVPRMRRKYKGVKDLSSWHKNAKTVWNG
jgi:hypothetical protein